jgi:hypothetical protein
VNTGRASKIGNASKVIALNLFVGLIKELSGDADITVTASPATVVAINFLLSMGIWSVGLFEFFLSIIFLFCARLFVGSTVFNA